MSDKLLLLYPAKLFNYLNYTNSTRTFFAYALSLLLIYLFRKHLLYLKHPSQLAKGRGAFLFENKYGIGHAIEIPKPLAIFELPT